MNFNFKKNNLIIILLLIFVILSCIVYFNMLNVKEGMTTLFDRIKYKKYLTQMPELAATEPSHAFYKLKQPTGGTYKVNRLRSSGLALSYSDFSINEISYNNLSDLSLNNYHKTKGFFGISDNSNVRFLPYARATSYMLYIDFSSSTVSRNDNFNMIFKEVSGNIVDLSTNMPLQNLSIRVKDNGATIYDDLIKDGAIELTPPPVITLSSETINPTATGGAGGAAGTGGSVTLGDTNLNLGSLRSLFSPGSSYLDNLLFSQLLQNGTYGSTYVPPIYNNFETAMNLPSNPIVNPVNSMNPLQYAESLFGPNITPVMAKNAYLNQHLDGATVESSNNAMRAITSPKPSFDGNGNLLAQNSSANVSSNRVNNSKNIATEDYPPCPAPQRCPEPNFDCKKVPKYEQGPDNPFLPRPVLTDFSTFGM